MDSQNFIKKCIDLVVDYFNKHVDTQHRPGIEARMSMWYGCAKHSETTKRFFQRMFRTECITRLHIMAQKNEFYFDAYKKWENICIKEALDE